MSERILDFGGIMQWEITQSTADSDGALFEAVNVINPEFEGPPLHVHPVAEEVYSVTEGVLDVRVGRDWRKVSAGASATVPAGTPHTLRNTSGETVKLINVHRPAQDFERMFRRLHALVNDGVGLPPKDLRSAMLLMMLFDEHQAEITILEPNRIVAKGLARLGRVLRYSLPEA